MDGLLWIVRAALAVVFAVAGGAKLADRPGSQKSLVDFGVPQPLARPLAVALPIVELLAAIFVLPAATAWWAGLVLLALLVLFLAGIGVSLARGRRHDCHCFGQLHAEPIGWKTFVRNGLLAMLALTIVARGQEAQPALATVLAGVGSAAGASSLWPLVTLISLATSGLALFTLYHVVRQNGRMLMRLEAMEHKLGIAPGNAGETVRGLPEGTPAPGLDRRLQNLEGHARSLQQIREAGGPLLLAFTEPGCAPCETLLSDLARWQAEHAGRFQLVVVSRGTLEQNRDKAAALGLRDVVLQHDRELAEAFQVTGTPSAVLIVDDAIASPLAEGDEAVRQLVASAATRPLRLGARAPHVRLPSVDGHDIELAAFLGRRLLLLFWNPSCGFCQAMLDDLRSWENQAANHHPTLVVVSSGSPQANREQGLRAPVLLDQEFKTGRLFGVDGTPSAVVIDEHGVVASGVGVGAEAVLALAIGQAR